MRGFQYSGSFRSIRKASMNGLSGTLIWRNEWIAFLDGMMQMFVLGNDVRQTQLPLSIQKICIDVNMHNNIINNSQGKFFMRSLENIRCTNKFPPFFIKNWAFIMKERKLMFYSKYCPSYCSSCLFHES